MSGTARFFAVIGLAAATCAVASFVHEYRKMKEIERKLNSLPIHRMKERMADIKKEDDKTVIEIPRNMLYADKLRVCASILTAKDEGAGNHAE